MVTSYNLLNLSPLIVPEKGKLIETSIERLSFQLNFIQGFLACDFDLPLQDAKKEQFQVKHSVEY